MSSLTTPSSTGYPPYHQIHSISINDEGSLFVAALESGIRIYNMEPLVGKLRLDTIGSITLCKLLHRTNLIALVGGGARAKYADNSVLIWDDAQKTFVLEFTFSSTVLALRTRRDRLFVVERNRIHAFRFPNDPAKLFSIETRNNPLGLCEITPLTSATEFQLLIYPGHKVGSVQLLDLSIISPPITASEDENAFLNSTTDDNDITEQFIHSNLPGASVSISPTSLTAHQSEIACLALNRSGTLLATASQKGTLIRLFRTTSQDVPPATSSHTYIPLSPKLLTEFRRGLDVATLYTIVFSPDSEYLLAASDKGTVHIFALKETRLNRRSTFHSVPLVVNLGVTNSAVYSLTKFTLPAECACVATFGPDRQSVYAICVDGSYHKYLFSTDGTCTRDNYDQFLDVPEEEDHILL